jgi:hypothetical protein
MTGDRPFAIGTISNSKPFVHVLDDESLILLMGYLDTVSDFVSYLRKKESLVFSHGLNKARRAYRAGR